VQVVARLFEAGDGRLRSPETLSSKMGRSPLDQAAMKALLFLRYDLRTTTQYGPMRDNQLFGVSKEQAVNALMKLTFSTAPTAQRIRTVAGSS
jgi:hypothetical protein